MLNNPEVFPFYDEQTHKAAPDTDLGRLVAYVERLAGRKLRKSEIKLFSTIYINQYMRGREDGWKDVFTMDEQLKN